MMKEVNREMADAMVARMNSTELLNAYFNTRKNWEADMEDDLSWTCYAAAEAELLKRLGK